MSMFEDLNQGHHNLFQRLAHNDVKVRNGTLKTIKKYLSSRTTMTAEDMAKIWKGIFYCFWMSDKVPVQQELARNLAGIVHVLNSEVVLTFFRCFLTSMVREWGGIDRLRIDKYLSLVRRFVEAIFIYIKNNNWDVTLATNITQIFFEVLVKDCNGTPRGVTMHVSALYFESLARACESNSDFQVTTDVSVIPLECFTVLMGPVYALLTVGDSTIINEIISECFNKMLSVATAAAEKATNEDENEEEAEVDSCQPLSQTILTCFDSVVTQLITLATKADVNGTTRSRYYKLHKRFILVEAQLQKAGLLATKKTKKAKKAIETVPVPAPAAPVYKKNKSAHAKSTPTKSAPTKSAPTKSASSSAPAPVKSASSSVPAPVKSASSSAPAPVKSASSSVSAPAKVAVKSVDAVSAPQKRKSISEPTPEPAAAVKSLKKKSSSTPVVVEEVKSTPVKKQKKSHPSKNTDIPEPAVSSITPEVDPTPRSSSKSTTSTPFATPQKMSDKSLQKVLVAKEEKAQKQQDVTPAPATSIAPRRISFSLEQNKTKYFLKHKQIANPVCAKELLQRSATKSNLKKV